MNITQEISKIGIYCWTNTVTNFLFIGALLLDVHLNFQELRLCASFFTKLPRLGDSEGTFRLSSQAATSAYFSTTHGTGQCCGSRHHCIFFEFRHNLKHGSRNSFHDLA